MNFSPSAWIDARIRGALDYALPELQTWFQGALPQLTAALVTGVTDAMTVQVQNIPQLTTNLMSAELQQLPQQVGDVLNVPGAIAQALATGLAGLPQEIAQAIRGLLPFPLGTKK